MEVMNSIEHVAMDLQTPEVETQLTNFGLFLNKRSMKANYDYQGKGFNMTSRESLTQKITKLGIHLRSQGVEKFDHPALRQSLYFHELKNIDQHIQIPYPKNSPRN